MGLFTMLLTSMSGSAIQAACARAHMNPLKTRVNPGLCQSLWFTSVYATLYLTRNFYERHRTIHILGKSMGC